jgi:nucleotide-binding universal stress UspA family protein
VLIVARPAQSTYENAVVGTNFSEGSRAALQATLRLFPQAEVTTLHAYRQVRESMARARDPDAAYRHVVSAYTRFVTDAAPGHWRKMRRVAEIGYAETLLQEYAEKRRIDLIAVGLENRHPLLTFLLGGTVAPLVRRPSSDVLIVPTDWDAASDQHRAAFGRVGAERPLMNPSSTEPQKGAEHATTDGFYRLDRAREAGCTQRGGRN